MRIFSTHRKKLEPRRRFGGLKFRSKVKQAANYKRIFNPNPNHWTATLANLFKGHLALWRNLAIVLFLALFYYLVISTYFVVANIEVSGTQSVSAQLVADVIREAGNSRLFLIKKNDFFLLTPGRVNHLLTTAIPEIKYAKATRSWPNKIRIEVTEHNPGFVIDSNGNYFLVDDEGVIVKQVDSPDNLVIAHDQLTENFAQGEMLNTKLAPFVISMIKQWPSKVNTAVAAIKFPGKQSSDVEFVTAAGWSVLFDTSRAVVAQLDGLALLLGHTISARDQTRLAYIDLRSSKWQYYCFQSTPCSQIPQPDQTNTIKQ